MGSVRKARRSRIGPGGFNNKRRGNDMRELKHWESFYVIVGAAAGALIGLQFVVMTLLAERPPPRAEEAEGAFARLCSASVVQRCCWSFSASTTRGTASRSWSETHIEKGPREGPLVRLVVRLLRYRRYSDPPTRGLISFCTYLTP